MKDLAYVIIENLYWREWVDDSGKKQSGAVSRVHLNLIGPSSWSSDSWHFSCDLALLNLITLSVLLQCGFELVSFWKESPTSNASGHSAGTLANYTGLFLFQRTSAETNVLDSLNAVHRGFLEWAAKQNALPLRVAKWKD
jgi:hypothetical protein